MTIKKKLIGAAIAAALGTTAVPQVASADVLSFDWAGKFTMLDSAGAALANTSITTKGANQYQTSVTGTLTFNTATGSGSGTLVPFNFFAGTLPAEAVGINMQAIGDGSGGPGTLVMGNMLFNWNGTNGIPVSIVLDAAGMFGNMQSFYTGGVGTVLTGVGATPAADGTYVSATALPGTVNGPGGFPGYLGLGPNPIVTTAWNTTSLCTRAGVANDGACMNLSPSGGLPLITDVAPNTNDFVANTGGTIGGTQMIDGPFTANNANFDITSLTLTDLQISQIPVPAAVWLFGSGLLGLVGVARRKKV
jgi:hypothetical protein